MVESLLSESQESITFRNWATIISSFFVVCGQAVGGKLSLDLFNFRCFLFSQGLNRKELSKTIPLHCELILFNHAVQGVMAIAACRITV